MTTRDISTTARRATGHAASQMEAAGRLAAQTGQVKERAHIRKAHAAPDPKKLNTLIAESAAKRSEEARVLLDNVRLIQTALKETRDFDRALRKQPVVVDPAGGEQVRTVAVATAYLTAANDRYNEEGLIAFLRGYQEVAELKMAEIWALKPALQAVLLNRISSAPAAFWPALLTSLRLIGESRWQQLFEAVSIVDRVLERDPAGAYAAMDYDSREAYRKIINEIAKRSPRTEREIAEVAVTLAAEHYARGDRSRASLRRSHVGFYLIDQGLERLREAVAYRPSLKGRLTDLMLRYPNGFYLAGVEVVTFAIVIGLLSRLDALTPVVAGFLLLILPATQAAVEFMNHLTTSLLPPRALPKLDFESGIPDDCLTMVAVPTLLLNEAEVHDLVLDLEIRFLANRDRNLLFALLTDSPDSDSDVDERDALVDVCRELIEGLNSRYGQDGRAPFYLFHRHRTYNPSEGRWMGWERKRGKLHDLNQLLRGGFDSFPVKVGDLSVLHHVKYVITLDSDTQLPRDSAARLVGTIAHPLNRAVIDPSSKMVVEGYGILQPRIGVSVRSASRSRLAALYSGQTGFDIYTRAVSDVYQDLYGEGIFTGKGIYEVDAFRAALENRFPENALLSHDLIEGAYARAALVSDVELIDDYPSHFRAYSRRKHRWVRGDWQILRWLLATVPDYQRRMIPNPITLVSKWKILDNLRRSLIEPNTLLLFLAGWLYVLPGRPWFWTVSTVGLLLLPVAANTLFSLFSAPWGRRRELAAWTREAAGTFVKSLIVALLGIVFLLHQALLSLDAIVRSIMRVFVTKRRLLEWETAAEAEKAVRRKATVDVYLDWSPWIALAIGVLVFGVHPSVMPVAAPIIGAWFLSRSISEFLNRAPKTRSRQLKSAEAELLRDYAERMCRFFVEWSTAAMNWMVPDNVHENGQFAPRLSPTNAGLLLNARIAAVHFGQMKLAEFVHATRNSLDILRKLEKHRGHMLNWYDLQTLKPLEPRFVSTVDSGNLAACLWTVKQAALAFAKETPAKRGLTDELASDLRDIAEDCESLVQEMDFSFLYHARKRVLSVGYDVGLGQLSDSSYDLLASEARIASFVAIAKNDIPQEEWFHLGRGQTLVRGERVLLSWTGTMFEYLMPTLWMRDYPDTLLERSMRGVVNVQRDYARRKGVPWGISESACSSENECDYGYAAFGIQELAMKRHEADSLVISPYSTFLALSVDAQAAMENLRRMAEFDWLGRYGFYEAVDYSKAGARVIRIWMAHHQGMSLLAACNVLFDDRIQEYFHAEPQVMATELLLHERVPPAVVVDAELPVITAAEAAQA
jgi:cyclic beta-1,2-glucan synthetase